LELRKFYISIFSILFHPTLKFSKDTNEVQMNVITQHKKIELKQRAFNAMMGLATGDAISWPSLYHRSYLLPFWTRRIRREIDCES